MNFSANFDEQRLQEIQAARTEITKNAQFDKAFIIMNALAATIASYGLLADSSFDKPVRQKNINHHWSKT